MKQTISTYIKEFILALALLFILLLVACSPNDFSEQPVKEEAENIVTTIENESNIEQAEDDFPVLFEQDGLYGYKKNGKTIVEPKYIKAFKFDINTRMALVRKIDDKNPEESLDGYINENGEEVIPLIYNELTYFDNDVTIAKYNGFYGVIDINNEIIVPFEYQKLIPHDLGENMRKSARDMLLYAEKNEKMGVINFLGDIIIPLKYDQIFFIDYPTDQTIDDLNYFLVFPFYRVLYLSGEYVYKGSCEYVDMQYEIIDKNGESIYISPSIIRFSKGIFRELYSYNYNKYCIFNTENLNPVRVNINDKYSKGSDSVTQPDETVNWKPYQNEPEYEVVIVDENTPYEMLSIEDLEKRINN